jgi:hypothetical protein
VSAIGRKTLADLRVSTLVKLAPKLSSEGLLIVRPTAPDKDGYPRTLVMHDGKVFSIGDHRLVAWLHLGRPLTADEIVHHRNGDKTDNRWENFLIVTKSEHGKLHSGRRAKGSLHPFRGVKPQATTAQSIMRASLAV